jgi:hypothetical protein
LSSIFDVQHSFVAVPYEKGYALLFYLEGVVGDDAFGEFLKFYVKEFKVFFLTSAISKSLFIALPIHFIAIITQPSSFIVVNVIIIFPRCHHSLQHHPSLLPSIAVVTHGPHSSQSYSSQSVINQVIIHHSHHSSQSRSRHSSCHSSQSPFFTVISHRSRQSQSAVITVESSVITVIRHRSRRSSQSPFILPFITVISHRSRHSSQSPFTTVISHQSPFITVIGVAIHHSRHSSQSPFIEVAIHIITLITYRSDQSSQSPFITVIGVAIHHSRHSS